MTHRRLKVRIAAGVLALVVAITSVTLLSTAGALPPTEEFCAGVPAESPFTDVPDADDPASDPAVTNAPNILCLAASEITVGTNQAGTLYSPGAEVTRRQMALFIKRLIDTANELELADLAGLPAYDQIPDYPDVATEDPVFQEAIGQLTQADIVGGFTDGTYRPNDFVLRDQMARFIVGALEFMLRTEIPEGPNAFTDDDTGVFNREINKLARAEIVIGTASGTYNPRFAVQRRPMASFLIRSLAALFQINAISALLDDGTDPDDQLNIVPADPVILFDGDTRDYTVTGLDAAEEYRVTLLAAESLIRGGDDPAFEEDGETGLADAGNEDFESAITSVNGEEVDPSASQGALEPTENGQLTFEVTAGIDEELDEPEVFVPVVYTDEGGDNTRLNLDDDGRPTEPFGIGGGVLTVFTEAEDGVFPPGPLPVEIPGLPEGSVPVDFAETELDFFFSEDATYFYDEGDVFTVDGEDATLAEFEEALSVDDGINGTYDSDPAGESEFNLDDVGPDPSDPDPSDGDPDPSDP